MSPGSQVILHADMDAFYASVEQRDHPELMGRPVVVGGDSNRGVISAASYEARRFGIRSAMPSAQARQLCPELVFLRGDMAKYSRESKRIFEIFRRFTPLVEGLSLDEAFLDLTGTERLLGSPRKIAEDLRAAVRAECDLAVSCGIAPVKMVAKIASDEAKPDGVVEVTDEGLRSFLDPLAVGKIWGVGPVAQKRLEAQGIHTIGDLARSDPKRLERAVGDWGLGVRRLARGQDLRDVEPYRDAVSMSEENTFGQDIEDRGTMESAILSHAEAVARRLRRSELVANTVVLKLKLARRVTSGPRGFPLLTRRETLSEPTDDGDVIARTARALLARAELTEPIRLLGVGTTNLTSANPEQLSLLPEGQKKERRTRLNKSLDELADRFGPGAVRRAGQSDVSRAGLSFQIKRGEDIPEEEEER